MRLANKGEGDKNNSYLILPAATKRGISYKPRLFEFKTDCSLITKLSSKKNKGTQCSEPVPSCSSIAQYNYDCYSNTQIEIFQSDLHSFPYRNS